MNKYLVKIAGLPSVLAEKVRKNPKNVETFVSLKKAIAAGAGASAATGAAGVTGGYALGKRIKKDEKNSD